MASSYKIDDLRVLRSITGAGVKDCKEALINAAGDLDKAKSLLRELAKKKLIKKIDRVTNEGSWFLYYSQDSNVCAFIEVACETDFVAISDYFVERCNLAVKQLSCNKSFLSVIEDLKLDIVQRVDENIQVGRCFLINTKNIFYKFSNLGKSLVILVPKNNVDIDEDKLKSICCNIFTIIDDFIIKNDNSLSTIKGCCGNDDYLDILKNKSYQIEDKLNSENINKNDFEIIVKLNFSFYNRDNFGEVNNNFTDDVMELMKKYSE